MIKSNKSKAKEVLKNIFLLIIMFAAIWFLLVIITIVIKQLFEKWSLRLDDKLTFLLFLIPTTVSIIAIVLFAFVVIKKNIDALNKIQRMLPSLGIFLLLAVFFAFVVLNDDKIVVYEVNSLLSIEWTIFGVSLAIFIFWLERKIVRIEEYSHISISEEKTFERLNKIVEIEDAKSYFAEDIPTILFFALNLFVLLVATSDYYISTNETWQEINVSTLMLSLMLTTNCLIQVATNIVISFLNRRRTLLANESFSRKYNIRKEEKETIDKAVNDAIKTILEKYRNTDKKEDE